MNVIPIVLFIADSNTCTDVDIMVVKCTISGLKIDIELLFLSSDNLWAFGMAVT